MKKSTLSLAIASVAAVGSPLSLADTPVYEEVIVTAQKHSQNLQDIASAITALDGENLDVLNIADPFDMSDKVPGLVVSSVQGYRRTVSIRGVGNEIPDNAGTKPAVAYHLDGVFLANDYALNSDLMDVERIEITRGPDGTLYGNSSTGGAINVISKRPDFDSVEGYIAATAGDYARRNFKGAVNLPLGENLALRVSASHREQEGYVDNIYFDNYKLEDEDDNSLRLQLAFRLGEQFDGMLQHHIYRSDTHGPALKGSFDTISSDPRKVSHDTAEYFKLDNDITSLHLNWHGELFTVSGIFSHQEYDMKRLLDVDRTSLTANDPAPLPLVGQLDLLGEAPLPQFISDLKQQDESKTAEINITSNSDSALRWVVGAFYLDTQVFSNTSNFFDAGRDGEPLSQVIAGPNVFANNPDLDFINADYRNFESSSIFGQLNYKLTEQLAITAGLRHTKNEFQDERCNFNCVPDRAKISSRPANKTNNVTGKLALEYNYSDGNLIYGSVATGVKPAGSNSSSDTRFFPEVFDKELVTAYEIGSKNLLMNKQVRLNMAAFYYDYEDYLFESSGIGRFAAGASNLPAAEIYGLELEADAQLN
ncbi:MAG: TonB-dependent receptor, partial [Cellvibrionaceae bacterium]|nr:TonB-dependent receptor [Cellvibrionaceae bacterium]